MGLGFATTALEGCREHRLESLINCEGYYNNFSFGPILSGFGELPKHRSWRPSILLRLAWNQVICSIGSFLNTIKHTPPRQAVMISGGSKEYHDLSSKPLQYTVTKIVGALSSVSAASQRWMHSFRSGAMPGLGM